MREYSREASPPTPETAASQASASQPVVKWSSKDLYIGVSTVQVTGNPKGTSVVKDAAPSQVRPREPMSVLMLANREVVNTEMGAYRDRTEQEECSQPMDDIQVSLRKLEPHSGPGRSQFRSESHAGFMPPYTQPSPSQERVCHRILLRGDVKLSAPLGPHFPSANQAP